MIVCHDCGGKMNVKDALFCCHCGSKNLQRINRSRILSREECDKEFDCICEELNKKCAEIETLHDQYQKLLRYYRRLRNRKAITLEEMQHYQDKFHYRFKKK